MLLRYPSAVYGSRYRGTSHLSTSRGAWPEDACQDRLCHWKGHGRQGTSRAKDSVSCSDVLRQTTILAVGVCPCMKGKIAQKLPRHRLSRRADPSSSFYTLADGN